MASKLNPNLSSEQAKPCPVLFYGIPEVAVRLSLGHTSVWGLIRDKRLPVVRIGRRTLVPAQALQEFAAKLVSSAQ